jgi:excisionase family DNA binding protein
MNRAPSETRLERLLTIAQVAELLGTTERFPRRLVAERRIEFVRVGRHVRIRESALADFIAAGRVEPVSAASVWHSTRGAA